MLLQASCSSAALFQMHIENNTPFRQSIAKDVKQESLIILSAKISQVSTEKQLKSQQLDTQKHRSHYLILCKKNYVTS